jgi:hypothetical protein
MLVLEYVGTSLHMKGDISSKKRALYTIHVGNFTFHFFSILHLTFQKNTQEFMLIFQIWKIELKKM